jgi:hypothetical protein
MKRLLLLAAFLLLIPSWLGAVTKYVVPGTCTNGITTYNPAGSGTCTGGSSTVYSSIPNAQTTGSPGDIFDVRAGSYSSAWTNSITSGTSGSKITWQAHAGETVTITTVGTPAINLYDGNKHDLIFDGFTIDQNNGNIECGNLAEGTLGNAPDRIRIQNLTCKNTKADGFLVTGDDPQFSNLTCTNCGDHTDSPASHAIYLSQKTTNALVENSNFSNCGDACIQIYDTTNQTTGAIIRNNKFHDINANTGFGDGPIVIRGATGALIYNNLAYDYISTQGALACIGLLTSSGTKIYNNTCYGNGSNKGIVFNAGANNVISKNNLVYNFNTSFTNNGTGNSFATNFCTALTTGCSLSGNPLFVSIAGDDYRLTSGSSAIGSGTALTEFSTDIVGTTRPQGIGWDIGAYEYLAPPCAVTVLSPNGGESFGIGTSQSVQYSVNGCSATVNIKEDQDGNGSYETTIVTGTSATGNFSYTVSGSANANRKMQVCDGTGSPCDTSDGVYAATGGTPGTITVTFPSSGFHFFPDQTVPVTFSSTGISGKVEVLLSRDNGRNFTETVVRSIAFNQPDATWVIDAAKPNCTQCVLRVRWLSDPSVFGDSPVFKTAGVSLLWSP